MKTEELLQKLVEVRPPWRIIRVRDDLGKNQIDIWLAHQTGRSGWLFGSRTTTVPVDREHVWRHLNIGVLRCMIHAEASSRTFSLPWGGYVGVPFTNAMSRLVVGMMRDGVKLHTICSTLDISVGDLWKFKHSMDIGETGLSGSAESPSQSPEATHVSRVPEPDSLIWVALLDGSVNLDIRLLSLRLLLAKMREQMRVITDREVQLLKCYELQRFFLRFEKTLDHELSQIEQLG